MPKWRHRAPQIATPRSQKGPAAEGVALKINSPIPRRGSRVWLEYLTMLCRIWRIKQTPPSSAGPHPRQNRAKTLSRQQHKNTLEKLAKMCKNRNPAPPKPSISLKNVISWVLQHLQQNWQNDPKMEPEITSKSYQVGAGGFPEAMTKRNIKINSNEIPPSPFWEQKLLKTASRKAYPWLNFLKSFLVPSLELPLGGPRTPKIIIKSQQNTIRESFFSCTSAFVAAYVLSSKENSRRKSLQQFSPWALPAVPWEGEDAHTIPADCLGGCLGVRRWPAQASSIN